MATYDAATLRDKDKRHVIHPLHHPSQHEDPHIWVEGKGIYITDDKGKTVIDGLSGLWNVNAGHGREELAKAAYEQMKSLAYHSGYVGQSSVPSIELATKLAEIGYPGLNATYFANSGAEANESAIKTARWYWRAQGKPGKFKVISRKMSYHGTTLATMSACGMPMYWKPFEPRVPGFLHINSPNEYRFQGVVRPGMSIVESAAQELEDLILWEGPETVGAFLAEPVQANGIIVPGKAYWERIREICRKYDLLWIADEVITGFGRTGQWFGLMNYDIEPDIMTFAKAVTSGYQPLGGMMVSDAVWNAMQNVAFEDRWTHSYTYSGHPTTTAVGVKTLEIYEREGSVANAKKQGARLGDGFKVLQGELEAIGDVRGVGLIWGIELVADREGKKPYPADKGMGGKVAGAMFERGLLTRCLGDMIFFAPPLCITAAEVDKMIGIVGESVKKVCG